VRGFAAGLATLCLLGAVVVAGTAKAAVARAAGARATTSTVQSAGTRAATSTAHANTLLIAGAGDGHGVGMSQDGALGFAQHGYGYQAILAHYYTGTALGQVSPKARVRVMLGGKVHKVPLEAYVRGVVAAEMSPQWPLAALEAQAVASRTYALTAHAGEGRFDVYADTRSQVYRGRAAETPATNRAVAATAGQIVTYAGKPAITYFFASSGGSTESVQNAFPGTAPEPWLQGVPDPFDTGPEHAWSRSLSFAAAGRDLSGLVRGGFRGIEVLKRGISPRIISANILGTRGRTPTSGNELAARFGLYDTWAYFSIRDAHGTHREPDRSGVQAPAGAAPVPPATPSPPAMGPGGGTTASSNQVTGGTTVGR
jgi:stage II sporulation protein D